MAPKKLFTIPQSVTPANFELVMQQAIALELATIPTYLSTYYSINRAQDQDKLYAKLQGQLKTAMPDATGSQVDARAQELKVDVLVFANRAAALIMSVVIEEMLHLALACNVKQAIVAPPDLMSIGKSLEFPTQLDGHEPEFPIHAAKLSLDQLSTFLQIESPEPFTDPADTPEKDQHVEKYKTIGLLYDKIIRCIKWHYPGPYPVKPQLLPPQKSGPPRPYYSQNSVNTVYYDRDHNPQFGSADDSGDLIGVVDAATAIAALKEIQDQGEGNTKDHQHLLKFDENNMPVPLPVDDRGEVLFEKGDYDDAEEKELSHFAKFLELYSIGGFYEQKFAAIEGIDDFWSYFVYDQASDPKQADYDAQGTKNADGTPNPLPICSKLGNAIFTYILLMTETCYYVDEKTQYGVFLYGVHKAMIWLLSGVGNHMNGYSFTKGGKTYAASLTFEHYDFSGSEESPKEQIIALTRQLAEADKPTWGWLTEAKYADYWPSLPDVSLDHKVMPDMPKMPA